MESTHQIFYKNSNDLSELPDRSVDLIVTSPPYPMIEMWDDLFARQDGKIGKAIRRGDGKLAFELMHRVLDGVWHGIYKILKFGGIACVNIGDATRTISGGFSLYPNHSRILAYMQKIGFSALPAILWRKQTNAPNKFMGSGMMPPGAYVTLEHEYILILRKGDKREFLTSAEKHLRRASAYFWEERNNWFSDVWMDLKGASQNLFDKKTRNRSAAFPFELPYRLISMFSVKGDTVVDPFLGIGTTMYAAMVAGRNSIGYEIDPNFEEIITSQVPGIKEFGNLRIDDRLEKHLEFVESYYQKKGGFKYENQNYHFPVVTNQERELLLNEVTSIRKVAAGEFEATYSDTPQAAFCGHRKDYIHSGKKQKDGKTRTARNQPVRIPDQQKLFDL